MTCTILPVQRADVPILAQIAYDASRSDVQTQLKSASVYGGYDDPSGAVESLNARLARPPETCRMVKAVSTENGEIMGWVAWGYRGYEKEDNASASASASKSTKTATATNEGQASPESKRTQHQHAKSTKKGIARLEELTDADMRHWMNKLMPEGTKCMFISSIVVDPKHQGKHVGKELVEYGTSQADRDGVFCWVHSSEAGWPMFAKAGFEEVGRLEVNLDEFAEEEAKEKAAGRPHEVDADTGLNAMDKYGVYTFRYMKRMPRGR